PLDSLKPVITSSKINNISLASQTSLSASKKPSVGGTQPILPATGSIIIQAISLGLASINFFTFSISLYLASKVSFAVPCVTPGLLGVPHVLAPLPAWIKKESLCPCQQPANFIILSLLVKPLANLTALIQASVPEFTKRILSIFGTIETANSAILVSISVGIPKEVPFLAFSITA